LLFNALVISRIGISRGFKQPSLLGRFRTNGVRKFKIIIIFYEGTTITIQKCVNLKKKL
jgi:hypothetical protein